jgi:hypothetical protein
MKLKGEIVSVSQDSYNHLEIFGFGEDPLEPWAKDLQVEFTLLVPDTKTNRRAFYVGRTLKIEVTPQ